MTVRVFSITRFAISAAAMLPTTVALAHSGHGAPSVHAHTGSPSMLAVLGIVALGVASLAGLARLILRRRRLRRQD
ncbi:hypothetical protein [Halomonas rhizosphaerae]|uniref:LPXTG cell wall anchor domain-containing protein n=1 Tax=Halomonas rhizosphaerae TaxID=3043296 RepID=A0ABT6UZR3_9GAMM|nr:hypothetical protein [Halomonas rhizosphaerae]MDI5891426.1 hypothetical protein [Halomonas rhizosphaerae]MDI5921765.1 hypothetical protein [Halomonas rhizosphaerae]